jgi:hypothetical protein
MFAQCKKNHNNELPARSRGFKRSKKKSGWQTALVVLISKLDGLKKKPWQRAIVRCHGFKCYNTRKKTRMLAMKKNKDDKLQLVVLFRGLHNAKKNHDNKLQLIIVVSKVAI